MKAINSGSVIIPFNKKREMDGYCLYGIIEKSLRLVNANLDIKDKLKNKEVTALYYNRKYRAYGVVKDDYKNNKPILLWLRKSDLDIVSNKVLNYDNLSEVINIKEDDEDSFLLEKDLGIKIKFIVLKNTSAIEAFGNTTSKEKFIESVDKPTIEITVGDSNIEHKDTDEQSTTPEDTQEEIKDTIENTDDTPEKIENTSEETEDTPEEIKDVPEKIIPEQFEFLKNTGIFELNETIKELNDTKMQYKEALSKISGKINGMEDEQIVGVIRVLDDTEETDYDESLYSVYNTVLKLLKTNDTVSVPRIYYEHLAVLIHRNIFISRSGENYESIVQIKFVHNIKENMLARVEYDKTQKYTRITVIKEMNNKEVSETDIVDYEVRYNEWRRHNSFFI